MNCRKRSIFNTGIVFVLGLLSALALYAQTTSTVQPAAAAKADKPETELEKTMAKMNKALRQVRKASREGKLAPATAEEAVKLTPALEAEKPEVERAKFHADFQAQI